MGDMAAESEGRALVREELPEAADILRLVHEVGFDPQNRSAFRSQHWRRSTSMT
jgi:hypothetical protein